MSSQEEFKEMLTNYFDPKLDLLSGKTSKLIDKFMDGSFRKNGQTPHEYVSLMVEDFLMSDEVTKNGIMILKLMNLLPYYEDPPTGGSSYSDEVWVLLHDLGHVKFSLDEAAYVSFKLFKVLCLDIQFTKANEAKMRNLLSELEEIINYPEDVDIVNECYHYLNKLLKFHYK